MAYQEDGYDITVASEIMAVLCLSKDITDLKERLGRIIVGYTWKISEQKPVTAHDLHAEGAMCALLKDALKRTLFRHWSTLRRLFTIGPFANIAHGCNSVTATKMIQASLITPSQKPDLLLTSVLRNSWISSAAWLA